MYSVRCCLTLNDLEFYRQIFLKVDNIKFYTSHFGGSRVVQVNRQTDRQTEESFLFI
jgi:hypothetical protein